MNKVFLIICVLIPKLIFCQIWPLTGTSIRDVVTSCYGPRDKDPNGYLYDFHRGYDLHASSGTNVYASIGGVVRIGNRPDDLGNYVRIWDNNYEDGVIFAHLSEIIVQEGATVNEGTLIGLSGNTGNSSSAHLHYTYYVNQDDIVWANMYHPLNLYNYSNSGSNSPEITNATCDNNNNVTTATITVQTAAAELDFIFFQIDVWPYSKLINFDLSSEYRTDNNPITISLDPDNPNNTKVNITTTPMDFNYQNDSYQVINFTLDFSQWNSGTIYASDLCFYVGDIDDVYNDYNEQDTECSFSAAQNLKKTISLKELKEQTNE